MKLAMTNFSIRRPILLIAMVVAVTGFLGFQMRQVQFDNDPENMLAEDEPVRLFHHKVKEQFDLYDFVVVGIVNEENPDGIFNVETLGRIYDLTGQLLRLHRDEQGLPAVALPALPGREERVIGIDMRPDGTIPKLMNIAFRHNPNRLFNEQGEGAIIGREIISPSVVDNIKQADLGSLKIEYLMEKPPQTREEALLIRDDAMANPLYAGTLVSEDGKAVCLYLPIRDKHFSYNVANLVRELTADWGEADQVHITGLPVAEDTFGVEMLVQMATSAPMAGLAIFILMFLFFRRLSLIIAPMLVAVGSIIMTMGLLIGLGYKVHIMSSMIAIFLMPIAVADAIHVLSEFFDTYPRFQDKDKTIRHVIGHLFLPMLYTTLTTIAGFASLATTPIPPVRVFGLHVAFGVGMAWLLTMTLVPAYIKIFVSKRSLADLTTTKTEGKEKRADSLLASLGSFSFRNARWIVTATVLVLLVSVFGISKIRVNDNPVNWFTPDHSIRVADRVLNAHFGGTYTAYLQLAGSAAPERVDIDDLKDRLKQHFAGATSLAEYEAAIMGQSPLANQPDPFFAKLEEQAAEIDRATLGGWADMADKINYLQARDLDLASFKRQAGSWTFPQKEQLLAKLAASDNLEGEALIEAALQICDVAQTQGFVSFVSQAQLNMTAATFKRPEMLRYLETLGNYLAADAAVGKTSTASDALKKARYELQYVEAGGEANDTNYAIPDSVSAAGQVFSQLEGMKKKDSLFHLVSRDYSSALIWVQLRSGDNIDMERVVSRAAAFTEQNPPPHTLDIGWAGLTYINVAWQEKMVRGMLIALVSSFFVVLLMMVFLFRSFLFGLLAMIPLTVTITFTYGLIGLVGKEYDMPIAVLSSLTLGLSVDFAIHFLQRGRELYRELGSWQVAISHLFREPARAISRNAITISVGFTPLLLAPLIPYKTVGFFLATIMAVSWLATLFILAALVTLLRGKLFKKNLEVSS